jgi:hypothetical protein
MRLPGEAMARQEDPDDEASLDRSAMADDVWDSLLGRIAEGRVVPVIGAQLLVDPEGRSTQARIAARMLAVHRSETDAASLSVGRELDETIALLRSDEKIRRSGGLYEKVYDAIVDVTADDAAIPTPIRQLGAITDFQLLVTVTPDNMLARCVAKRSRVHLNEIVHSPNNHSADANDLPADWKSRRNDAYLLYLFGKAQRTPRYAIHEEDVLEYAHNVIALGNSVPRAFLAELLERDLLFIGCRFPDWLSRFFLRATNRQRLSGEREKREWMVERLEPTESLTLFLNSYSKDTEILSKMEPAAFVDELYLRWSKRQPTAEPESEASPVAPVRGSLFFVSYSRVTDEARAEAFVRTLIDELGVKREEVWFDRLTIEPGDDFKQRIVQGIKNCYYFVPIVSDAATARDETFMLNEWRQANARLSYMGRKFVLPMVVDAEHDPDRYIGNPKDVPDWPVVHWSSLDFGHAPEGVPDPRTLGLLRTLIRQAAASRSEKP